MISIQAATAAYEEWLGQHLTLLPQDVELKHQHMAESPFLFLRATFYRWMQLWPAHAGAAAKAPAVLAVGDLHVSNFGTWRDKEARLVWGINDFDEAYTLPYTLDLVRLATSAHMAVNEAHLSIAHKDACEAILAGYRDGLAAGGAPLVLAEQHTWLRHMMSGELRNPELFWAKMNALGEIDGGVPGSARKAVQYLLPGSNLTCHWTHRVAGLGSLGRQRFVALAMFDGAQIAREAKAMAPSACIWSGRRATKKSTASIHYQEILDSCVRATDPFVELRGGWIVRRLAPDCSRVELSSLPRQRDEGKLLHAMGFETANIHLSRRKNGVAILADLKKRPRAWLHKSATAMLNATMADFEAWRKG